MGAWSSSWRRYWARCEEPVLAIAVSALLVLVVTAECDRRDRAVWLTGYRAGAEATAGPARWGSCWRDGRGSFPCARTPDGRLLEVRVP